MTWQSNSTGEIVWTKQEYFNAFQKVKSKLDSGVVLKMILSRLKEVKTEKNTLTIFKELNQIYPSTFNYILSNKEIGTWIGATPELLLNAENNQFKTVALAGTKPADGFSEWTEKEKKEQQFVTDFILEKFRKNNCIDFISTKPYTITAGPVQHLKTDISAVNIDPSAIWTIVKDLHPTPATCGIPKEIAKEKIAEIEMHDRKFYAGFIGILNGDQKTFFVNLRCMELQKSRALLYVGGGITAESIAENEWLETERKAVTLLKVLN